jgi:tetratricopeptide (TPR) repeat protein
MSTRTRYRRWFLALGVAAFLFAPVRHDAQAPAVNRQSLEVSGRLAHIRDYLAGNQVAEGLNAAERFLQDHNSDPEVLLQLGVVLALYSQHSEAAAVFARVNELRPHSPDVLFNLGIAYFHLKQLDQAALALAESADLANQPAETHYVLAMIAADRSDHENAIMEVQHAIARAPRHANYYDLLGQEFSTVGYWQGAAEAYRRAATIEPNQSMHFMHLGQSLFRANELSGAIDAFKEAARLDPHLPEINYIIAFAYQNDGQFEQARHYYLRQLMTSPDYPASLVGAGTVAVEQRRFADAEKLLESALAGDPDNVQANYEMGLLWFKEQRYDRAIEALKHVLWLQPDHTQAEYYLYLALSRTRQESEAAAALAAWKKLETLDRLVRSEEVAYDMARAGHWQKEAAKAN